MHKMEHSGHRALHIYGTIQLNQYHTELISFGKGSIVCMNDSKVMLCGGKSLDFWL